MVIFQNIATGGAFILGITYIFGGLIVNLSLARRGMVEYQILKVKYLVVGLIFILQTIAVMAFAALPAFALALADINNIYLVEAINILSILSAITLLLVWARLPSGFPSFLGSWFFWFIASAIGTVFPAIILFRELLFPIQHLLRTVIVAQAILTEVLVFIASIYHYSAYYYGQTPRTGHTLQKLDPIGVGTPMCVQFACENDKIALLNNLGVPKENEYLTNEIYLIDETDKHYIISFYCETGARKSEMNLKIDKDMVKAILYRPDHIMPIEGEAVPSTHKKTETGKD